jgi:hypothetical protein
MGAELRCDMARREPAECCQLVCSLRSLVTAPTTWSASWKQIMVVVEQGWYCRLVRSGRWGRPFCDNRRCGSPFSSCPPRRTLLPNATPGQRPAFVQRIDVRVQRVMCVTRNVNANLTVVCGDSAGIALAFTLSVAVGGRKGRPMPIASRSNSPILPSCKAPPHPSTFVHLTHAESSFGCRELRSHLSGACTQRARIKVVPFAP